MSESKRKIFTGAQKAKVALEAVKGTKTAAIQSIIKIQQNGSLYFYFGRTPFSPLKLESAEFQLSSGLDRS